MIRFERVRRLCPWLGAAALLFVLSSRPAWAQAPEAPATQPAATPAAAPTAAPDPIGFNGGPTAPLLNPNPYLTGWVSGNA